MSRMPLLDQNSADPRVADLLGQTQTQLGRVPNLYAAMANAPAALAGYLAFRGALVKGVLSPQLREQIALLTANDNGCTYCVSAHAFRGSKIGLSPDAIDKTFAATADDPKTAAALAFARAVLAQKGDVSDDALAAIRAAGWGDEGIGEIVAHVALNVFSNVFNHVAQPELDFPRVDPVRA